MACLFVNRFDRIGLHRLAEERDGAVFQPILRQRVDGRDNEDGNVTILQIGLQTIDDFPAVDIGQTDIERDRDGGELSRQRSDILTARGHDRFHPGRVRAVRQSLRKTPIVFHNQHHLIFRADVGAIIRKHSFQRRRAFLAAVGGDARG